MFPFRIYSIGGTLYFGTNLEGEKKQALLKKKQDPERYGADDLTVSDLAQVTARARDYLKPIRPGTTVCLMKDGKTSNEKS
mgnify:CR=1 FL=1